MQTSRTALLSRQLELAWSLFAYHLAGLTTEDFHWEPAAHCWTVRRGEDGAWRPDFAEREPDPVPIPTVAWLTWHLGWWWTGALDHLRGEPPRPPEAVPWPGPGEPTVAWLSGLHEEWRTTLASLDDAALDAPSTFPVPDEATYTLADTAAWVNAELMKNVAEIGQLLVLRRALAEDAKG